MNSGNPAELPIIFQYQLSYRYYSSSFYWYFIPVPIVIPMTSSAMDLRWNQLNSADELWCRWMLFILSSVIDLSGFAAWRRLWILNELFLTAWDLSSFSSFSSISFHFFFFFSLFFSLLGCCYYSRGHPGSAAITRQKNATQAISIATRCPHHHQKSIQIIFCFIQFRWYNWIN